MGDKKKAVKVNFFYLNGNLMKRVHIDLSKDIITVYNFTTHRRESYNYSDVKIRRGVALTTSQVTKLINRKRLALELAILDGHIERPQFTYSFKDKRKVGRYMWSEEDVMAAHDYFSSLHFGRPRKDGLTAPYPIPTKREIRAMLRNETILYIKQGDEFVPTWQAERF